MAHLFPIRHDPEHWRQRAQDARAAATYLEDPESKRTIREIAEAYEEMAVLAERSIAHKSSR